MGFAAIERAIGVNHNTFINRIKLADYSLPNFRKYSEMPEFLQKTSSYFTLQKENMNLKN